MTAATAATEKRCEFSGCGYCDPAAYLAHMISDHWDEIAHVREMYVAAMGSASGNAGEGQT